MGPRATGEHVQRRGSRTPLWASSAVAAVRARGPRTNPPGAGWCRLWPPCPRSGFIERNETGSLRGARRPGLLVSAAGVCRCRDRADDSGVVVRDRRARRRWPAGRSPRVCAGVSEGWCRRRESCPKAEARSAASRVPEAVRRRRANRMVSAGAGGGNRTHTTRQGNEILSLARLPVSPLRHGRESERNAILSGACVGMGVPVMRPPARTHIGRQCRDGPLSRDLPPASCPTGQTR